MMVFLKFIKIQDRQNSQNHLLLSTSNGLFSLQERNKDNLVLNHEKVRFESNAQLDFDPQCMLV